MIRKFEMYVEKAHKEVACVAVELAHLATKLEPDDYFRLVEAGTRPIIAMEIPKAMQMVAQHKEQQEQVRSCDEMKNMKIEDIIIEQNLPTPLARWKDSKVLLPMRYLAAAVHYFVYSQADQQTPMTNKFVSEKFKLNPSNLHQIITGRCYAGGRAAVKAAPEDHARSSSK